MTDPRQNRNAVLSPSATSNENKVTVRKEFFIKNSTLLGSMIKFFLLNTARIYQIYHTKHFEILLRVITAIRAGESIENQIREIEANIKKYVDESLILKNEIEKVPPTPWFGTNPLVMILMLPLLKGDMEFVKVYNENLDAYENLVAKALDSTEACVDSGRQIESKTPDEIQKLEEEIEKLAASGIIDTILQKSYEKNLDLIKLDLAATVKERRSDMESSVQYLRNCWDTVLKAERL